MPYDPLILGEPYDLSTSPEARDASTRDSSRPWNTASPENPIASDFQHNLSGLSETSPNAGSPGRNIPGSDVGQRQHLDAGELSGPPVHPTSIAPTAERRDFSPSTALSAYQPNAKGSNTLHTVDPARTQGIAPMSSSHSSGEDSPTSVRHHDHGVIPPVAEGSVSTLVEKNGRELSSTNERLPGERASENDGVPGNGQLDAEKNRITRQPSQVPAVGIFGGVAPSGPDAEMGLRPVRSHEEELEREAERAEKGPDPWAVTFEPGEKANPKNWGYWYRWCLTGIAGLLVLNSTFASSSPSGIITDMETYFGFSQEVGILTISLFVAGYCVGPIVWGPLSETYGRRPIFIVSFVVYTGFQVGCALSRNTASILIFRFLGGCFASAPLTNSGALLADVWDGDVRGKAMAIFALAPFAGPSIGPICAGFVEVSGTSWRWVFWVLACFAGGCLIIIVLLVPETYTPILLVKKAKRMRKETGEERWYAPLERTDHRWKARLYDITCKPFVVLAHEPMLQAVTLYMSFVYGVVYLLFEAYPFVFVEIYHFNSGENGCAFLGLFLGGAAGAILNMTYLDNRYQRHVKEVYPKPPKPEKRLEFCVISAWAMVIAMFWFGWTSYASIHWIVPILATALLGFSILGMFVSLFNYIIDVYLWVAASALAATTVARSVFGAAFPTFASQMYAKLGVHWASSLLGFLALLMTPIPIVLMRYGNTLRSRSKYSPNKAVL